MIESGMEIGVSGSARLLVLRRLAGRLEVMLTATLAKALLDWSYAVCIAPLFASNGFVYDPSVVRMAESYALLVLAASSMPARADTPGRVFTLALFFVMLLPMLSLYSCSGGPASFLYVSTICFVVLGYICQTPALRLPTIRGGRAAAVFSTVVAYALSISLLYAGGALQHVSFDLASVYKTRELFQAQFDGTLINYLINWTFKAIAPFLMVLCLMQRRWLLFVGLVAGQVMFFGVSGHKVVLVAPILVVAAALFVRRTVRFSTLATLFGLVIAACTIMAARFDFPIPASFLIRRALYLPARLAFGYHDFFERHGFVFGSNTIFRAIANYPYPLDPPAIIGQAILGSSAMWANNGFIACGYMHFGWIGMVAYAAIVALLLRLLDSAAPTDASMWSVVGATALPVLTLTNSDLSTTLLTHGLGLALLLQWLSRRATGAGKP